ncbi:MAG: helix-turn-helix domain-containing protein [bacterium]|nr:helix-turn-helix domain-containing protein [bacterium]
MLNRNLIKSQGIEKLYSIKELSQIWSIPKQTLYRWVSENSIPCYKINGYLIRLKESDAKEWIERFRKEEERAEYTLS